MTRNMKDTLDGNPLVLELAAGTFEMTAKGIRVWIPIAASTSREFYIQESKIKS